MKTDDLIALLAKDTQPARKRAVPVGALLVALAGGAISFAAMVPWLGIRPDLARAVAGPSFWMKALYAFGLCAGGLLMVERLSRPGGRHRLGMIVASVSILAVVAIAAVQLLQTPPEGIHAAIFGSTWNLCFWRILVLALPALAGELWLMRGFAPTRPAFAGAAAGLLAGGLAAVVYGFHCDEYAMPMVAIWYSLGIALSTIAGAMLGSRVLRW